jgi:hypothetical protein
VTVTMLCRDTCTLCACRLDGRYFACVRVNKRSLRTVSVGIGVVLPCPECGTDGPPMASRWALDPDSQARVDAYRARKGWAA